MILGTYERLRWGRRGKTPDTGESLEGPESPGPGEEVNEHGSEDGSETILGHNSCYLSRGTLVPLTVRANFLHTLLPPPLK